MVSSEAHSTPMVVSAASKDSLALRESMYAHLSSGLLSYPQRLKERGWRWPLHRRRSIS